MEQQKQKPLFPKVPSHNPVTEENPKKEVIEFVRDEFIVNEGIEHKNEPPPQITLIQWKKEATGVDTYIKVNNQSCLICGKSIQTKKLSVVRYSCFHAVCLKCVIGEKNSIKRCPECTIDFNKNRPLDTGTDPNYSQSLISKIGKTGVIHKKTSPAISEKKKIAMKLLGDDCKIDSFVKLRISIPQLYDHLGINTLKKLEERGFTFSHLLLPDFISDASYLAESGISKQEIRDMFFREKNKYRGKSLATLLAEHGYTAQELKELGWEYSELCEDGLDKNGALEIFRNSKLKLSELAKTLNMTKSALSKFSRKSLVENRIPIDIEF